MPPAYAGFSTPPAEPGVRLSPHRALHSSVQLSSPSFRCISPAFLGTSPHVVLLVCFGIPTNCLPSPCARLSRPPTTMAAPTPPTPLRGNCSPPGGRSLTFTAADFSE